LPQANRVVRPNFMSARDQQLGDAAQPANPFPTISIQLSKARPAIRQAIAKPRARSMQ
jgi:hypothetical protein